MDTRILKYFLAVAREENITKAAEMLHITQPTLSRQLSKLEDDLGVRLMVRDKNGVTLTDEGILFRRRAEEITELADKAEQELGNSAENIEGTLSIGCGELASVRLLTDIFKSFQEIYPNVQLDLYTGNADQIKQRLDDGLNDIGILLEPVEIDRYDFIRFKTRERWFVVMRSDSPLAQKKCVTPEDLINLPLIVTKRQCVRNEIENWFGKHVNEVNIVATINMSTNASILVEQGIGYAIVIEGSLPYIDKNIICMRPLCPEKTATSVIAWKKSQTFAPAARRFLEYIRDKLSE